MIKSKHELEQSLVEESRDIRRGALRDDNPVDTSPGFQNLCEAVRRGDVKTCQQLILNGVNVNARDTFDYTPLILVCPPAPSIMQKLKQSFVNVG
jgi:ankyrin repeat/BTB/POZ domain-containing protein 1